MSEKTEEPTPKRLRKAREEGDSGASANLTQALAFLAALAALPAAAGATVDWAKPALAEAIAAAGRESPSVELDGWPLATAVIALCAPLLVFAGATGAVASVVQTGGFVATKRLTPKLDRLNVFTGLAQLFSAARLFAVARALAAGGLVAWLAYRGLREAAPDIARTSGHLAAVAPLGAHVALRLLRDAALSGIAIGVVDLLVVRRGWLKKLRMSKDEVKREHKESDGDPQMKAARERAHHEMLASATVGNVKNAAVVVVNPTHIACALRYDEGEDGDGAPVVIASGEGDLAQRIVRAAHDYGVPVVRDVPLARALRELEIGDAIPEALYEAVAAVLHEAWAVEDADAATTPEGGDHRAGG